MEVHKFMDIGESWEWYYFINQLPMGAKSAGFSSYDVGSLYLYFVRQFGPKIDKEGNQIGLSSDDRPGQAHL